MHYIRQVCSPFLTALASQNWHGAVNVEVAPPASDDNNEPQYDAHAVDNRQTTGNISDPGASSADIPSLPASILSGTMQTAHACLMAGAYTVVFPLGAIGTHIGPPGRGQSNTHICCQLIGLAMVAVGFGLGCWLATQTGIVRPHPHSMAAKSPTYLTEHHRIGTLHTLNWAQPWSD